MRISTLIAVIAAVTASTAIPTLAAVCTKGKYFDKVLTIILENEDASSAFKDPYLASLATQGYTLTNYNGVTHPSQGNYVALTGGDTLGITGDGTYNLAQTNIVDLLEAKSLKWKTYQENYPGGCATASSYSSGLYVRKHNPFMSFTNIAKNAARCANIVTSAQLDADIAANNLPEYMFYTPNMKNDGHDTTVGYASNWLKTFLTGKLGTPAFANTLIFVTFDESESYFGANLVYGVLLGAGIKGAALKDSTFYNHYSWLATIEDNYSLGNLGRKDVSAVKIPLISGGCSTGTPITTVIPTPPTISTTVAPTATVAPPATTSVVPPVVTTTTPTPTITPCAHSICATGVALKAACDSCVSKIIAADSYCGTTKWDATCVGQVKSVCGLTTCA